MAFDINDIRSKLRFGGWRPSHFQVIVTNPFSSAADQDMPFMVRAAQLPTVNIGKIPVFYFGRPINVPGDRTYEDWNTTVINDENFIVKNSLEIWHNNMNALERNVASTAEINAMKSVATVRAFGKDGRVIREYQLNGIFPLTINAIETDWQATDQIAEFQVVWAYDDFVVIGGDTGDGGGS